MENFIFIFTLAIAAPAGMLIGYQARKILAAKSKGTAEAEVQQMIQDGKNKQKEILLQAKDKAMQVVEESKRKEEQRQGEVQALRQRLEKRENLFDKQLLELENKQQNVQKKAKEVDVIKEQIQDIRKQQIVKLEKVAALSKDDARKLLLELTEQSMKEDLNARIKKLEESASEEYEAKARTILSTVIQRYTASHVAETTTTTVSLPSDDMKGRIIGKEGRNIKAIETLTGVEIIVDDTPGEIIISGFSPIRRHLAKRALDLLMADGRIHPTKIEDAIEEAKKQLAHDIYKAGEEAAYEAGVVGLPKKLLQILGRLKYRTSYGQNVLRHSLEVSQLAGMLAEELGGDVAVCKKGGLLHDIGKAVDHEIKGGHPEIGREIMRKFGLPEEVAYIAVAHHEDRPKTLEGVIAQVADQISGSRPGARKDTLEKYIQRLEELEGLAGDFGGVEKVYAIQAGREIRVFVRPEEIDDFTAQKLAKDIAHKIEEELKYPGEIKVNVIRETRTIEYAR
ncbi:MAG: ribonuclease Y [Candidatus Kerfeldbacteria bacterium RIFCSPHIGHO2_12_FULL_48_17]|uniref:Ribonuclease Y n=1 Tax=Candidatus Kerfeldbacteria bacterium RIFCSPHIGHO2_12_FULL_48_17 TaxID=1798542 RepID=A0A1G2B7A7_9BACT|nr:MAG: ribonuclease Y [Candidatus Kerfeldbacteria bacterium RIFCSPHIGHO2_12_FULL_48_17]